MERGGLLGRREVDDGCAAGWESAGLLGGRDMDGWAAEKKFQLSHQFRGSWIIVAKERFLDRENSTVSIYRARITFLC